MDVRRDAERASASQGDPSMANEATQRRCIGSARFGIEPHDAPADDFPKQPSQKDGLGRMCKEHWNAYTAGLARDAKAWKAAVADEALAPTAGATEPVASEAAKPARRARTTKAAAGSEEIAS
jgi:hypothetical protein